MKSLFIIIIFPLTCNFWCSCAITYNLCSSYPVEAEFRKHDRLNFSLILQNIPKLPFNQKWELAVLKDGTEIYTNTFKYNEHVKFNFSATLYNANEKYSFKLQSDKAVYFAYDFLHLKHVTKRKKEKHGCLTSCHVVMSNWPAKVVITNPTKSVIKYAAGDVTTLVCVGIILKKFSHLAWRANHTIQINAQNKKLGWKVSDVSAGGYAENQIIYKLRSNDDRLQLSCASYGPYNHTTRDEAVSMESIQFKLTDEPYVSISPSGEWVAYVGDDIAISCKGFNMNMNSKVILYEDTYKNLANSQTKELNYTIKNFGDDSPKTVMCRASYYNQNSSSVITISSIPLNLCLQKKDNINKTAEEIVVEPSLSNTTLYRSGNKFVVTCKARNTPKNTYLSWTKIKDKLEILNTSESEVSLDIILTEKDNNSILKCSASHRDETLQRFIDGMDLSTVLILDQAEQVVLIHPIFFYLLPVLGVLIIITIALLTYKLRRSRQAAKTTLDEEVKNEIYEACSDVVYAQIYTKLNAGPVPQKEPLEYARIIGFYQPKR